MKRAQYSTSDTLETRMECAPGKTENLCERNSRKGGRIKKPTAPPLEGVRSEKKKFVLVTFDGDGRPIPPEQAGSMWR